AVRLLIIIVIIVVLVLVLVQSVPGRVLGGLRDLSRIAEQGALRLIFRLVPLIHNGRRIDLLVHDGRRIDVRLVVPRLVVPLGCDAPLGVVSGVALRLIGAVSAAQQEVDNTQALLLLLGGVLDVQR